MAGVTGKHRQDGHWTRPFYNPSRVLSVLVGQSLDNSPFLYSIQLIALKFHLFLNHFESTSAANPVNRSLRSGARVWRGL